MLDGLRDLRKFAKFEFTLSQSGHYVLRNGVMTIGRKTQWVTASGSIYGRSLELEIMPVGGTKSYTISIDAGYWPFFGTYTTYRAGAFPQSGSVKAFRQVEQGKSY